MSRSGRRGNTSSVADLITDERVASVLRTFVRGCDPILPKLREAGDVTDATDDGILRRVRDRIEEVRWPGSAKWARLSVQERTAWWISRVGRLTALAASVTGLAGALGDRLPLQDILGGAGQGLLLCAIAGEHGVDDRATRVRLLAKILFDRDLTPEIADGSGADPEVTPTPPRLGVKPTAKWLWRQGRLLLALQDELEKRPHGRFYHRFLGMLPIVGMLGDYLGERSALKRAARAAGRWLGQVST